MRIVVTSDGSGLAERGLIAAASLARDSGAELLVLRVVDPGRVHEVVSAHEAEYEREGSPSFQARGMGAPVAPPPRVIADRGQAIEASREAAIEELGAEARRFLAGVPWSAHVVYSSNAVEAITDYARDKGAALIVMSTHGRSGISQALAGSVTTGVIRAASVPVVVVGHAVSLDAAVAGK